MKLSKEIDDLTYKIIGICMDVHRELGPGFPEEYYQRALEIELAERKIPFQSQKPMTMLYKEIKIGINYLDFDIDEKLILEIKSVATLNNVHLFQTLKYIGVTKREAALLVNFGKSSLEYKRVLPTKKIQEYWNRHNTNNSQLNNHNNQS
ncbi:MAG: GxxExxY protein [Bacteroidota bacterium]|nr:GxxExxY protein [Bacteroidota bacterium]